MKSINAVITGTYGKTRDYRILMTFPAIGDEWIWGGYAGHTTIKAIESVGDDVAETTSGDPKEAYSFYKITVEQPDVLDGSVEEFEEYVAIQKTTS